MAYEDLTGKRYGDYTALEYMRAGRWLCRCVCGVENIIGRHRLENSNPTCRHGTIATKETVKRIVELRNSGKIWREIAEIMGRSQASCIDLYSDFLKGKPAPADRKRAKKNRTRKLCGECKEWGQYEIKREHKGVYMPYRVCYCAVAGREVRRDDWACGGAK